MEVGFYASTTPYYTGNIEVLVKMATAGPGPSTTAQALLLPGQPIPNSLIKDKPVLGSGCYKVGGKILSSVVGRPRRDGAVSLSLSILMSNRWERAK